jgi:hypothetical protein
VSEDWFIAAIDRVADAGNRAASAIDEATRALDAGRRARLAGRSVPEIVDDLIGGGGRAVRFRSTEAFRDFERAVARMRAEVVRALVDEAGMSLSEAAKRLQISRQAAGRLYGQAVEDRRHGG